MHVWCKSGARFVHTEHMVQMAIDLLHFLPNFSEPRFFGGSQLPQKWDVLLRRMSVWGMVQSGVVQCTVIL